MKARYSVAITFAFSVVLAVVGCGRNKETSLKRPENLSVTLAPAGSATRLMTYKDARTNITYQTLEVKSGTGANNRVELAINDLPKNLPLQSISAINYRYFLNESMGYTGVGPILILAVDLDGDGVQDDTLIGEPAYTAGVTAIAPTRVGTPARLQRVPADPMPLKTGVVASFRTNVAADMYYSLQNLAIPGSFTVPPGSPAGTLPGATGTKSLDTVIAAFPNAKVLRVALGVGAATADANMAGKTVFIHFLEVQMTNGSVRAIRF